MKEGKEMPAEQGIERLITEYGDATFIKAMKHYDSFKRKSSEKTWLTRIAINCCKNIMRMNWFRLGRGQLEENRQTVVTDPIENVLEKDSITRAIQNMEVQDRELIILYYYQELSMKEIAQVIGKSENVTIQRVNRARKKLKKILMEVGYGL